MAWAQGSSGTVGADPAGIISYTLSSADPQTTCPLHEVPVAFLLRDKEHCDTSGGCHAPAHLLESPLTEAPGKGSSDGPSRDRMVRRQTPLIHFLVSHS